MLSPTTQVDEPTAASWELIPGSRTDLLREMYWAKTHERARARVQVQGSGEDTLVGHARDFATLLAVSKPFIQEHERIVGSSLAVPEDPEALNLGHYDPHYPPGFVTLLRLGFAGVRDQARAQLDGETDPEKRDFLRAVEISYDAACAYVAQYAILAREMAAGEPEPLPSYHLAIEPISTSDSSLSWLVRRRYSALGRFAIEQLRRLTHLTRERPLIDDSVIEGFVEAIPPVPTTFLDDRLELHGFELRAGDQSLCVSLEWGEL